MREEETAIGAADMAEIFNYFDDNFSVSMLDSEQYDMLLFMTKQSMYKLAPQLRFVDALDCYISLVTDILQSFRAFNLEYLDSCMLEYTQWLSELHSTLNAFRNRTYNNFFGFETLNSKSFPYDY